MRQVRDKTLEALEEKLHAERDNPAQRVRSVNPCFTKGADPSGSTGFSISVGGNRYWSKGCEIQQQFLSRSRKRNDPRFRHYALFTQGVLKGQTHFYDETKPTPEGPVAVIPCHGQFRDEDSAGTKAHRKILGRSSQFTGCVPLERGLEETQLVSRKNTETLDFGYFLREGLSVEEIEDHALMIAEPSKILKTSHSEMAFYRRTHREIESWAKGQRTLEGLQQSFTRTTTESITSELFRARPADLIRAQARRLYESNYFEPADVENESAERRFIREREARHLQFSALLISRKLEHADWAKRLNPEFPVEQLSRYCAQVHAEITKTMPELFKRCRDYLNDLTRSQREALEVLYMNGFENPSQRDAARLLGISKSALLERVSAPLKQLEQSYPELKRKSHSEEKQYSKWVNRKRLILDGCLNIESIQNINSVTRFCPNRATALEMNPPKRRLTRDGVARPKSTPQVSRSQMWTWLSQSHVYSPNRQDDQSRTYAIWKRLHAKKLEAHQALVKIRNQVIDESTYKVPLSNEERLQHQMDWVSLGRVKDPKCLQLPRYGESSNGRVGVVDDNPGLRVNLQPKEGESLSSEKLSISLALIQNGRFSSRSWV